MVGVDIAYLCTQEAQLPQRDRAMRYVGKFVLCFKSYLPNKFEVCISTHYEDIKGNTKCRNWGGLV